MPRDPLGLVIAFVLIAAAVAVGLSLGHVISAKIGLGAGS